VVAPDLAGFIDAEQRLRTAFAEEVRFIFASDDTYPPGTVLDPESGRPMDPLVAPASSLPHTLSVQANVAYRTGGLRSGSITGQSAVSRAGVFEEGQIIVIVSATVGATVEGALEFLARGERWKVTAQVFDGIGGIQRHVSYGDKIDS
jgi:hypothetical protein